MLTVIFARQKTIAIRDNREKEYRGKKNPTSLQSIHYIYTIILTLTHKAVFTRSPERSGYVVGDIK